MGVKYLDKSGLTYFWGKVKGIVSPKADKSEMSVTPGTGAGADKTTIQLKQGTSATVLTQHQDISGKADKDTDAVEGHLAKFDANGNPVDGGDTADYAKNLVAPVVQSDAEFVYRKTGGNLAVDGAGGAELQRIKGKTLAWNQHSHMNPSNSFTSNNCTVTYGTDRVTIVVGSGGATSSISATIGDAVNGKQFIVGHKYLMSVDPDFEMSNSTIKVGCSYYFWNTQKRQIYDCTQGSQGLFALRVESQGGVWETVPGTYVVRYPMLIDLTLLYGSAIDGMTNAQILAKFESEYPGPYYDYNPGTLISNDASAIETVGFNLWDEEWELGYWDSTGWHTNSDFLGSKNYIAVFPSTTYFFKGATNVREIEFWDADKNYINRGVWNEGADNSTFTTPANCRFITFYYGRSYGATYNHDICINLSDPAKNGTYEPYKKTVTTLNLTGLTGKKDGVGESVVVFPEGLRWDSSGTLYDEISGNKAIKRLGVIDLGTPTWSKLEYYNGGFSAEIPGMKAGGVSRIICSKYIVNNGNTVDIRAHDNVINANNGNLWGSDSKYVFVRNSSAYDTLSASEFKTSMSGVLLYYELATPEEYILDSTPDYTYPIDGDGTERRLPEDTASSVHAPFRADILYALNGSATLRNLDANYVRNDNIKQELGGSANDVMSQAAVTREIDGLTQRMVDASREWIDLSYLEPTYGNRLAMRRNTANCYVVRKNGYYCFPLVYGNGIKNGVENPMSYTRQGSNYTADFVNHLGNPITNPWLEKNIGCDPVKLGTIWWSPGFAAQPGGLYQQPISYITILGEQTSNGIWTRFDGKYACFYLSLDNIYFTKGAIIVLGAYDKNGEIIWSWTIWCTSQSLAPETITNYTGVEYKIMPMNLCSIWDDKSNNKCHSALYQWGRKDVIGLPEAYNSNSQAAIIYGSSNSPDPNGLVTYGIVDDSDAGGTVRSVANSIKMPGKFFLEHNDTTRSWNNLRWANNFWNAAETLESDLADNQLTAIKTIYDPCPVGYMVPGPRAYTGFTTTGANESDSTKFNVVGSFANGWNFKKNSADAVGAYWPASGYRHRTSGGLSGIGLYGYFWSFSPNSQTYASILDFNSGRVYPLSGYYLAYGFSVRPSVEL